jgi:hypothetical protein
MPNDLPNDVKNDEMRRQERSRRPPLITEPRCEMGSAYAHGLTILTGYVQITDGRAGVTGGYRQGYAFRVSRGFASGV